MLDAVLSLLLSSGGSPSVTVTCFFPDDRKEGGEYRTCHGRLSGFDEYTRTLLFEDGTSLSVENIIDLDSPVLSQNGDLSL